MVPLDKDPKKVARGRKSRVSGAAFERRVRKDLEETNWIVAKWPNNVEFETTSIDTEEDGYVQSKVLVKGKCVAAKAKWRGPKAPMMLGQGFPDFITYRLYDEEENFYDTGAIPKKPIKMYEVVFVEAKTNGQLSKIEREKAKWYLEKGYCKKFLIAEKTKEGRKVIVKYVDFEEKYGK